jgi:hypothetical protein
MHAERYQATSKVAVDYLLFIRSRRKQEWDIVIRTEFLQLEDNKAIPSLMYYGSGTLLVSDLSMASARFSIWVMANTVRVFSYRSMARSGKRLCANDFSMYNL